MFEFLENLRQKPVKTRKRAAFLAALSFSLFMLGIWSTIVYPDFSKRQGKQNVAVASGPSPLSTLTDAISTSASAIGSQFGQVKQAFTTIGSTTPPVSTTTEETKTPSSALFTNF